MAESKKQKAKKELTDTELVKKYDTGAKVNFPKVLKKVAKSKK